MFEYKKIKKESRMDIQVSGKQLKIGKSLTDYAKKHLDIINKKYLLRPTASCTGQALILLGIFSIRFTNPHQRK